MKITQETKQSKSPEKPLEKGKIKGRNEKGQFVKGEYEGGPGHPLGQKNFSTLMDETVKEIAKINKISTGEVWQILIKRGYSEAKNGNFPFYKDILDRYFGKAKESINMNVLGDISLNDLLDETE